jgi:hypothetical protein
VRELDLPENTVSEGRTVRFACDGVVTGIAFEASPRGYDQTFLQVVKQGRDPLFSTGREAIRLPCPAFGTYLNLRIGNFPPQELAWIPVRRGEVWRVDCRTGAKDDPADELGYDAVLRVEEWTSSAPEPPGKITESVWYAQKLVCPPQDTVTEQIYFVRDGVVTEMIVATQAFTMDLPGLGVQVLRGGVSPLAGVQEDTVTPDIIGWAAPGFQRFQLIEPVRQHEAWKIQVSNRAAEQRIVWAVCRTEEQRREPW